MPSQTTDAQYVKQALNGNTRAFGYLVDRHKNAVYGAAFAQLGDFSDAQDISQEAFLMAYHKLPTLQKPARFSNWLYSIVRNLCYDHLRAQKKTQTLDDISIPYASDPSAEHERRATHRRVQKAIAKLSKIHRETVTLYYIQGYTLKEISQFLDVPTGTIKRRLSDARHKLKEEMIDMVRDMFDAHQLPKNFQKVVVEGISKINRNEQSKLYVRGQNKRGFTVEIVGHQYYYINHLLAQNAFPRPHTYDFIREICKAFQIELHCVNLGKNNAELVFERGKNQQHITTSSGDALTLALAFDIPVYSDKALLKKTLTKIPPSPSPEPPKTPSGPSPITIEQVKNKMTWSLEVIENPFESTDKLPTKRARVRRLNTISQTAMEVVAVKVDSKIPGSTIIWLTAPNIFLPIGIGNYEASAIAATLPKSKVTLPNNPNTKEPGYGYIYDLLQNILTAYDITYEQSTVDILHRYTYFALCCFQRGKKQVYLDARPSDAISLALRCNATISVESTILKHAGMKQISTSKKKPKKTKQKRHPLTLGCGTKREMKIKSRRKYIWSCSDPKVATISQTGMIHAIKPGKAKLTAEWIGNKK